MCPWSELTTTRIEFPELVNYLVNISNTYNCLGELQKLTGVWPAIRTGGTTEYAISYLVPLKRSLMTVDRDRSFFDPALQVPVVQVNQSYYYYGPEYLKIASEHPGKITLGERCAFLPLPSTLRRTNFKRCYQDVFMRSCVLENTSERRGRQYAHNFYLVDF